MQIASVCEATCRGCLRHQSLRSFPQRQPLRDAQHEPAIKQSAKRFVGIRDNLSLQRLKRTRYNFAVPCHGTNFSTSRRATWIEDSPGSAPPPRNARNSNARRAHHFVSATAESNPPLSKHVNRPRCSSAIRRAGDAPRINQNRSARDLDAARQFRIIQIDLYGAARRFEFVEERAATSRSRNIELCGKRLSLRFARTAKVENDSVRISSHAASQICGTTSSPAVT